MAFYNNLQEIQVHRFNLVLILPQWYSLAFRIFDPNASVNTMLHIARVLHIMKNTDKIKPKKSKWSRIKKEYVEFYFLLDKNIDEVKVMSTQFFNIKIEVI